MGLSEKTTKDGLQSYIEVVSDTGVKAMLFGSNSNVMVTFEEPPGKANDTFKGILGVHFFLM